MSGQNNSVFSKGILLTLVFLLACMCINRTEAQTIQPYVSADQYNWKSGEDATSLLLSQVQILTEQLPGLVSGTPMHDNTLRRIAYFKAIVVEINKGASIAEALDLAIPAAATLGFSKEASYTPRITLKALHTETRILLTN
ncbi:MAG: hypothetical protein R3A50_15725 [Saprospiraceae bacterium]|nr:hypothetical protein [Saprospiraceae bacterium]MCB9344232.1 hypothetical protein [Lewinellaceae bacterium]